MISKTKFNHRQLRVGDHCLVQLGKHTQKRAEVILRGKTYLGPIIVRLESGRTLTFNSKTDSPYEIVAGARNVGGHWIAL